jgi:signal transduction histidine kinase
MNGILKNIGKLLFKPIPPITSTEDDTIRYWREKIVFYIGASLLYIGLFVVCFSVYAAIRDKIYIIAVIDVIVYVVLLFIYLSRKTNYEIKSRITIITVYILGVVILLLAGPYGAGLLWLFAFPVFAGILEGFKFSNLALIINLFTLLVFTAFIHLGMFKNFYFSHYNKDSWQVTVINFLLMNVTATIAITTILGGLYKSLNKQAIIQQQLQEEQEKLEIARKLAEDNSKQKSLFLANMSHEIRTPMNAILGFSDLLINKDYPKEKQEFFFNIIQEKGQYLLQLVNDLIDISKIEANQIKLNYEYCNLESLFEELEVLYEEEAQRLKKSQLHIQFKRTVDNNGVMICIDTTRLKQIIINLLSNALKFTEEGFIEFGYEKLPTDFVRFYVKDSGIGLNHEDQVRIFHRYEQAVSNSANKLEGAGLGLFITKNLVTLMGGTIWVESEPKKGSCFYFEIPSSMKTVN